MCSVETNLTSTVILPHHKDYWTSRRMAFAAIGRVERALIAVKTAPLYTCRGYDEDGQPIDIEENLAPFDELTEARLAVQANPNAMSVLEAQKRTYLLDPAHL